MKTDPEFKQKGKRVGGAGGFFNQLMSNNSSVPVVGEGATMLFYSDRDAYEVVEVDEAKKMCVIQRYNVTLDDKQNYEYKELYPGKTTLVWRWGSWKKMGTEVHFIDEARKKYGGFGKKLHEAYKAAGGTYDGAFIDAEIEGFTKKHKAYYSVSIIFGVKREYYDPSF